MNPFLRLAIPLVLIGAGIGALFTLGKKESKEKSVPGALPAPPPAAPVVEPAKTPIQEPQS